MAMLNAVVRRLAMETICTAGVVVVLLCVYGGARAWLHARIDGRGIEDVRSAIAGRPLLLPGKRLTVRGFDLAKHPYSFLIVTSPGCAYCVNSAPFHRTLVAAARARRIPLFVVIPGARGDSSFLSSSGLHNAEVIRWEDLSRRPNATPSVVLVNAGGVIRRIWDGELARDGQSEVLAAIRDPSRVTSPLRKLTSGESMLTPGSLRVLSSGDRVTVISVDERGPFKLEHPEGAINIPLAELGVRAASELQHDRLFVVDCTGLPDPVCSFAAGRLNRSGFRSAAVDFGWLDGN